MNFSIRPARRSEAKPLIGLYSESGRGKSFSSLLLARGFVGPDGRIVQIETEAGRGEAYADMIPGGYDVISLRNDFSPVAYGKAIEAAEESKADALIIDSGSHEWSGAGGVLSQALDQQEKGVKGVLAWQKPKMLHQRNFMLRLMQTPIPLVILCLRAKFPMIEKKDGGKKEWVRSETLEPDQAADILFELFVHGWIDEQHRLHVTKYTRPDLKEVIRDNEPISIETGERLSAWARGDSPKPATQMTGGMPTNAELKEEIHSLPDEQLEMMAKEAAMRGKDVFDVFYKTRTKSDQAKLRSMKPELEKLFPA
jgi:hypothetical protein